MAKRKEVFENGEFYHVYNRGVDGKVIFEDKQDFFQFLQMLEFFNTELSLGALSKYKYPANIKQRGKASLLVEIVAYAVNNNHYHLILRQVADDGISRFIQKVGTGYVGYFNKKRKRKGSLFMGKFKAKHIADDGYLRHVGIYVHLNYQAHQRELELPSEQRGKASLLKSGNKMTHVSSWGEYVGSSKLKLCKNKDYLLHEFKTVEAYKKYAKEALKWIIENKEAVKDLENNS